MFLPKEEENLVFEQKETEDYTTYISRMFVDDSEVFSFARRLSWSPDGSFFIVPAGVYSQSGTDDEDMYVSYGFLRQDTSEPAFILPSTKACPVAIRFCPILFKREESDEPFIDLPYVVAWAMAT